MTAQIELLLPASQEKLEPTVHSLTQILEGQSSYGGEIKDHSAALRGEVKHQHTPQENFMCQKKNSCPNVPLQA